MDYLVQHAVENVWCSPRQDRQFITRPKRISSNGGEVIKIELDWLSVYLPDRENYYHLYQIGGMHPQFLGLFPVQSKWVPLTDVSNKMGMIADLYSEKGVVMPKFETYYMVTKANNLIIATRRRDEKLPIDYNTEDLYFRVYTNAFFQSARSNGLTDKIITSGEVPTDVNQILNMQAEFSRLRAMTNGYAWAIINGFYSEEVSPITCKVGDLVDWTYDASVSKVAEFEIDHLKNFDSELDSERKYLIHYPAVVNRIEYQDDIDMFLVDRTGAKANGLYHHKNTPAALRMVTHKDYSISVQLVNAFVDGHPTWNDPQKLRVMMLIREGGMSRPLVFENNRIHELYKLGNDDIFSALIGDNAAVSNWTASHLEAANYPKIMRAGRVEEITLDVVRDAYGYNAISKLIGDTPKAVVSSQGIRMVPVERACYENSTAYEYNANGHLLGWYTHPVGTTYPVVNAACTLVEMIPGTAGMALDESYNQPTMTLDSNACYRMYVREMVGAVPRGPWKDVTDGGMYTVIGNVLTWLVNPALYTTLVRSDKISLAYAFNVMAKDGLITFDLIKNQLRNGAIGLDTMDVPMGELDIFLNGSTLQPGLDYKIIFPKVVIFNKNYQVAPTTTAQQIAIRYTGFCNEKLESSPIDDQGFVKWDLFSRNGVFDIRDGRVMRIVIDGHVFPQENMRFSETHPMRPQPWMTNGNPYSIRDMVIPMRGLAKDDTYTMRDRSRQIDKKISDYLSTKIKEPVPEVPNVIPKLYQIYSPFICKILHDLVDGIIPIAPLKEKYDDAYVRKVCTPYEWLLDYDPTQTKNKVDPTYVVIHPHQHDVVVNVDIYHYTFLERAVGIYMKGLIDLSRYLRLTQLT